MGESDGGMMKLIVDAGSYEAPSLAGILWIVVKHRMWHFMRGEGWRD